MDSVAVRLVGAAEKVQDGFVEYVRLGKAVELLPQRRHDGVHTSGKHTVRTLPPQLVERFQRPPHLQPQGEKRRERTVGREP